MGVMIMQKYRIKNMVLVALFTALIAVGAFVRIPNPFFPVAFTLQGVFCAFAGFLLGSKLGTISVSLYVLMGLLGFPVFTLPSGPQYVFQPTFGFLLGFILATFVMGIISELKGEFSLKKSFAASYAGLLIHYIIGLFYMYIIYNFHNGNPTGIWTLISGMFIYFAKDFILFSIIATVAVPIRKSIKKYV
jgi:biotin transport system substrate-specific component